MRALVCSAALAQSAGQRPRCFAAGADTAVAARLRHVAQRRPRADAGGAGAQYHSTAPALWPPAPANRAGNRSAPAAAAGGGEVLLHLLARPPQDVRSYLAQRRRRRGSGGAVAASPWFVAEVRAALGGAWPSTGAVALAWARRHCARATAFGFGGGQPGGAWHYWERPEAAGHSRLADHGRAGWGEG